MTNLYTPEEEREAADKLMKEMREIFKFSCTGLSDYMEYDKSAPYQWRNKKHIPHKSVKRIVEYIEMHTDDCVDLCQHLMEYYNRTGKPKA